MKYLFKYSFFTLALTIFGFMLFVSGADAASITWQGDESALWGAGGNWSSGSVPGASDVAIFDGTGNMPCTINTTASVAGIDINSGYTNTITQDATLTVGTSNYDQADGTFIGGDQAITMNGSFVLSGGLFTSTTGTFKIARAWTHSGGTFDNNDGTVESIVNSTAYTWDFIESESFHNFVADCGDGSCSAGANGPHVATGDTMIIDGTLDLVKGSISHADVGGPITVRGDVVVETNWSDYYASNRPVYTFSGDAVQTITLDSGAEGDWDANLVVDKIGGQVQLSGTEFKMDNSGQDLTIQQGTFNVGSVPFTLADDLTISGGVFNGGTATVIVNDLILSSGTLNSTTGNFVTKTWTNSGGTFNHNDGTVIANNNATTASTWDFNGSETFSNFNAHCNYPSGCSGSSNGVYLASGDNLIVEDTLTLTDGTIAYTSVDGGVTIQGDMIVGTNWDDGASARPLYTFSGSSPIQTLTLQAGGESDFNANLLIDKTSGYVQLSGASFTLNQSGQDLTVQQGTFDANDVSLTITDDLIISGGTFEGGAGGITVNDVVLSSGILNSTTGTLVVNATWTNSGGTFNHNNGTVLSAINASTASWNFNSSETFYNFTAYCANGGSCTASANGPYLASGDNLIVEGLLLLYKGSLGYSGVDGGVTVLGDMTVATDWSDNHATARPLYTFAGSAVQTLTLNSGAETDFDSNIAVNKAGGSVQLSGASFTMNHNNQSLTIAEGTFDLNGVSLTVSGGATETIVVNDGGNLQLQGGETLTADSASYPQFDAGSTVTYDGAAGPYSMYDWTMTNATLVVNGGASSVFTLGATETVNNVTITSGILSLGGNGLTVSTTFSNEDTLRLRGSETLSLPAMDTNSGTVEFTGDGDALADTYTVTSLSSTYYNLTINSTDGATDIFELGADTDINNDLTLTAGTYDTTFSNRNMTIGGDFNSAGATFIPHNGNVQFDDVSKTSQILGGPTFSGLQVNTSGKRVEFQNGQTVNVSNVFNFAGSSGNLVVLRSTSEGATWGLRITGSSSVDYVNVMDSDASSGNAITHAVSPSRSVDAGNNLNWSFNVAPTVATVTAVQQSDGSVLITFIMDDADDDDTLQALVQYNVGGGLTKATLSESGEDTSATYGDPAVENDDSYQVGNAGGYITSSSGANTVSTIWSAPTDATGLDIATAVITVTPYDGTEAGTPSSSSAFNLDTLAPTAVSVSYKDINSNGTVDRVDLVFDENIIVSSYDASDWSFPEAGSITLGDSGASYLADTVLLTVTADANETGGATPPTLLYTNNAGRLTDEFGNLAVTFGAPLTVTDASAPQIKSFDYKDTVDVDGKIDTITVNFTETVTGASNLSANDLLFDNVGEFTGSAFGANSSDLISGSAESVDVILGTASTAVDTNDSSGTLAISSQNSFSLTDGTTVNSTSAPQSQAVFVDESAPFLIQIGYQDADSDGQIDSAVALFSEPTTISYTDSDWVVTANGLTGMDLSSVSSGNGTSSISFTATAGADKTGAVSAPSLTFTPAVGSITDAYSNAVATFTSAFVDQAKPVILSSSPTDSSVAVSRTSSIAFTFSEPMASTSWVEGTTGFDSTPNSTGWSGVWSGTGNTIYTLSHSPFLCVTSYAITTTEADIASTGGEEGYTTLSETGGGSTFDGSLAFTTSSCSSTASTGTSGISDSSTLTNPVTDDLGVPTNTSSQTCTGMTSGSRVTLSWSVTSGVGFVNLYYSTNSGASYTSIAQAVQNSGSYSWTVPSGLSDNTNIRFKIEGTDLAVITSTYTTQDMNVCAQAEAKESPTISQEQETSGSQEVTQTPDLVVPIGMAIETIFEDKWIRDAQKRGVDTFTFPTGIVAIGSIVKLQDDGNPATQADSAVYYVGSDHRRHPFPNETVYKTWFTGFYGIKILDEQTMSSIPMGPMVTYRPGSTLVKFPSVNKVYVVDSDGSLRWIASEELAQALYGLQWNQFVIDVSESFYSSYTFGSTLTSISDLTWDSVMAVYGR